MTDSLRERKSVENIIFNLCLSPRNSPIYKRIYKRISKSDCVMKKYHELNAGLSALKSFVLEQINILKKNCSWYKKPSQKLDCVKCLKEDIKYLGEENQIKSHIIKTLSEKHIILDQNVKEISLSPRNQTFKLHV